MFPKQNAFHTITCDSNPRSVDRTKPARLKVADGEEVTVSRPTVQAESPHDVTQFQGPMKSCNEECVLIIDTQTGELTLERITNTVHLKTIPDESKSMAHGFSVSHAPFPTVETQTGRPQPLANPSLETSVFSKPATQNSCERPKGLPKPRTKVPKTDATSPKAITPPIAGSMQPILPAPGIPSQMPVLPVMRRTSSSSSSSSGSQSFAHDFSTVKIQTGKPRLLPVS